MREIVFLSGKGGTGKTTFTASFIESAPIKNVVAIDADVDAPNLSIYIGMKEEIREKFSGGILAEIIPEKCNGCAKCYEFCSFGAIFPTAEGKYEVNPLFCEGCGMCPYVCSENAINIVNTKTGDIIKGRDKFGHSFYMARLAPGKENTGKMVTEIKKKAKEENEDSLFITDGPPGIGCPVIATLSGATDLIIIAESTPTGYADVERLIKLSEKFELNRYIIMNKVGLSEEIDNRIEKLAKLNSLKILDRFPFSKDFQDASRVNATIVNFIDGMRSRFEKMWEILNVK